MTQILIISFSVFAIWYTMLEGEVFSFLGRWFETHLPGWMQQPLHECAVCMCPYYGTAIYWLAFGFSVKDWLLTVIPAMGLNVVIMRLWPKEEITILPNQQPEPKPDKTDLEYKAQAIYKNGRFFIE